MSWDEIGETVCPIARGLSVVGDRWTLLILRELTMGSHRFDDIQAQTGMSPHLLATRLKRLEADDVIERRLYCEKPARYEYYATEKGRDLDSLLLAIRSWGMKWGGETEEVAIKLTHKKTGEEIGEKIRILGQEAPFSFDDTEAALSKAFADERQARASAFQSMKKIQNKNKSKARSAEKALS